MLVELKNSIISLDYSNPIVYGHAAVTITATSGVVIYSMFYLAFNRLGYGETESANHFKNTAIICSKVLAVEITAVALGIITSKLDRYIKESEKSNKD